MAITLPYNYEAASQASIDVRYLVVDKTASIPNFNDSQYFVDNNTNKAANGLVDNTTYVGMLVYETGGASPGLYTLTALPHTAEENWTAVGMGGNTPSDSFLDEFFEAEVQEIVATTSSLPGDYDIIRYSTADQSENVFEFTSLLNEAEVNLEELVIADADGNVLVFPDRQNSGTVTLTGGGTFPLGFVGRIERMLDGTEVFGYRFYINAAVPTGFPEGTRIADGNNYGYSHTDFTISERFLHLIDQQVFDTQGANVLVDDPVADNQAASKGYVDQEIASGFTLSDNFLDLTGIEIIINDETSTENNVNQAGTVSVTLPAGVEFFNGTNYIVMSGQATQTGGGMTFASYIIEFPSDGVSYTQFAGFNRAEITAANYDIVYPPSEANTIIEGFPTFNITRAVSARRTEIARANVESVNPPRALLVPQTGSVIVTPGAIAIVSATAQYYNVSGQNQGASANGDYTDNSIWRIVGQGGDTGADSPGIFIDVTNRHVSVDSAAYYASIITGASVRVDADGNDVIDTDIPAPTGYNNNDRLDYTVEVTIDGDTTRHFYARWFADTSEVLYDYTTVDADNPQGSLIFTKDYTSTVTPNNS